VFPIFRILYKKEVSAISLQLPDVFLAAVFVREQDDIDIVSARKELNQREIPDRHAVRPQRVRYHRKYK
jgi:hypothetical protein